MRLALVGALLAVAGIAVQILAARHRPEVLDAFGNVVTRTAG